MNKYRFWSVIILAAAAWAVFSMWGDYKVGEKMAGFKLGLDLSGGTHLVYKADISQVESSSVNDAMQSLKDTIERRVNLFGVAEPLVQIEQGGALGDDSEQRLIVELPGVTDVEEAVRRIGETPLLEFRLLNQESGEFVPTNLSGRQLEKADIRFDQNNLGGAPVIGLNFNNEGKDLFAKITRENIGEVLGIFLDGNLIQAPYIREEIDGGQAVITGDFTVDEAKTVVRDLNYGALPMPISLMSTETIGSTLGSEALSNGITAGIYGLLLVALFMIVYYRLPGLIASIALAIYVVVMLFLFKNVPVTLTAAGIAGFIISIGMAIDANVIIFERMREEKKDGHGSEVAIRNAFVHAWTAIRDGQLTTLLGAVILFWFGTSSIEGFALVLGLGTIVSIWTSMVVCKFFMYSVYTK